MTLPTELLLYIFQYLLGKDLLACCHVCLLWKEIIENSDQLWRHAIMCERKNAFTEARSKSKPTLSWYNLYKSAQLWTNVENAEVNWREIPIYKSNRVIAIRVRNGVIAVVKGVGIDFYDIESLELVKTFEGSYLHYDENDCVLVLLENVRNFVQNDYKNRLKIVPKEVGTPIFDKMVTVDDISDFKVYKTDVYYVRGKSVRELYVCKRIDEYKSTFIFDIKGLIWAFKCGETFKMLTSRYGNFSVNIQTLSDITVINNNTEHIFGIINEFIFFDCTPCFNFYVRNYLGKCINFNYSVEAMLSMYSSSVLYSNVLICGTANNLSFYADLKNFDLERPIRKFDFSDNDAIVNRIRTIDVAETENGHYVVVLKRNKLLVTQLSHP